MAMYDSIFTGAEIDKGVGRSYVPTLQSAPTSSTLTFTLEGNTIDFEIGQQARVADNGEPLGYKFYQLYDITTSGNTKTAHWKEIKDINVVEYLTVVLTSNQTNPNSDLIGATVVITDTEEQTDLFSTTWQGTALEFEIPTGTVYQVTVGAVSGYATPAAVTHTAGLNKSRTDTFTYNTEILTVTIDKDGGSADISAQTVVVKDASNNTLGTLTNGQSLKIPYGVIYTATASAISITDYYLPNPSSITKNWSNTPTKSLTFTYRYAPDFVDLGLPSGLLWRNRNLGAEGVTDYGLFYSWGNTQGYEGGDYAVDTLYANSPGAALTADISLAYDAAYVALGDCRMPSRVELQELKSNCDFSTVTVSGRECHKYTSKINGNYIIIPLNGGIGHNNSWWTKDIKSMWWTSSYRDEQYAWRFESNTIQYDYWRSYMFGIRPVK